MKSIFLSFFLVITFSAFSANYSIQSKVLDKRTDGSLEMVAVRLLTAKDSTFLGGTLTDIAGRFKLSKVSDGNYLMEFRLLGYKPKFESVVVSGKSLLLDNIYMEENSVDLKAVEVTGMAAQMRVNTDTIEYNATAFKTAENAVVEDLLKRLPGVEVTDGEIKVNGEKISRIKVDGKKFFDGSMQMATKNLTAEMVDKIQVVDEKSEMAKLTGFEDDKTERIINLVIKENRRSGMFGNVNSSAGADIDNNVMENGSFIKDDFRYDLSTFINIMHGDSQTAFVGGANNTNSLRGGFGMGGGGGITKSENIGVNNNSEIKEGLIVGGDISFSHSDNETKSESSRENWLMGDTLSNNSLSESFSDNKNTGLRFEMEWKIDSLNTIIFQPNISFGRGRTENFNKYDYYNNGDSTSWGNSSNNNISKNVNTRMMLIYSHKSKSKAGRSMTFNFSGNYSNNEGEGFNISERNTMDSQIKINQKSLSFSDNYGFNFRSSYVEPLWNLKNFMEASLAVNYYGNNSEREQFDEDAETKTYPVKNLNKEYSNYYLNDYISEIFELNYRYSDNNINLMAGVKIEPSQNFSDITYGDGRTQKLSQNVVNYSPTMNIRYNIGERRSFLRAEYRGNSRQPSIQQMQPVKNNLDLMNETVGNPSLLPSYDHNLMFMLMKFDAVKFSSINFTLFGNITDNALVSNSIYDATGKQFNQTVNAGRNPFNINGSFMYNTPLITNRLHFNNYSSANYFMRVGYSARNVSQLDITSLPLGNESLTQGYGFNENISLTFTHNILEIGARGSFSYSNTKNSFNESGNQLIMSWSGSGNVNIHLPGSFNINSDLSYNDRKGYAGFDQKELILNAGIEKTIKNKWVLTLRATDLLRQRLNISQSIGDNYIAYYKYNTLPSFVLFSVSYKIASFNGAKGQSFGPFMGPGMWGAPGF